MRRLGSLKKESKKNPPNDMEPDGKKEETDKVGGRKTKRGP